MTEVLISKNGSIIEPPDVLVRPFKLSGNELTFHSKKESGDLELIKISFDVSLLHIVWLGILKSTFGAGLIVNLNSIDCPAQPDPFVEIS